MGQHLSVPTGSNHNTFTNPSSTTSPGGGSGGGVSSTGTNAGPSSTTTTPQARTTVGAAPLGGVIDSFLGELGHEVQYDRSMGTSRFLKTIRARHRQGALVVKVFAKNGPGLRFEPFQKRLNVEREALLQGANVLSYSRTLETERAAYLIRQWLASNLYDRISTRPFLSSIEKKWIAFQLLKALEYARERGISHGDIKTENILCTSSTWVLLTDFSSSFKPTYLPLDDPSTFSYYFDTSSRRTCYLAPERFYSPESDIARRKARLGWGENDGEVTESMDVFSLGCVLAEVWMEGTPPFTLSQLFKYRASEKDGNEAGGSGADERFTVEPYLMEIEDRPMRDLIRSMIARKPDARKTCREYLEEAKGTVFPEVFYTFLHPFLAGLNNESIVAAGGGGTTTTTTMAAAPGGGGAAGGVETATLKSDADDKIERVWNEWEMIMQYLGGDTSNDATTTTTLSTNPPTTIPGQPPPTFPILLHVPGLEARPTIGGTNEDGPALIVLSLLCANLRNCVRPSSVLRALDLVLALNRHLSDETRLDRLVPYLVACLIDDAPSVRAAAVRCLTQVLLLIETVTPSNASIYPEYILPNVRPLASDDSLLVRATYASCLSSIATQAKSVLETNQALHPPDFHLSSTTTEAEDLETYDTKLLDLQLAIQDTLHPLLSDPEPLVRRALLAHIGALCEFFGPARANDAVLAHLVTYLNSREWALRSAWNEGARDVASIVGRESFEEFLLPLMTLSLADKEEFVTARVLASLTDLMDEGLIVKAKKWELVGLITGFLCHPNIWIREGAASFLASTSAHLDETDRWCILYPTIKRLLRADIKSITSLSILDNAREPLSRVIFEAAVSWASRSGKSNFWSGRNVAREKGAPRDVGVRTDEDQAQLEKMRQLGMKVPDDEVKLNLMREYISRLAVARQASKMSESSASSSSEPNAHRPATFLQDLGIIPETVFFNVRPDPTSSFDSSGRPTGIPRRFSLDPPPFSITGGTPRTMSEVGGGERLPRSRQVSAGSTMSQVEDLRRKLALGSTEPATTSHTTIVGPSPWKGGQRTVSETSSIKTVGTESSSTAARVGKKTVEIVAKAGPAVGEDLANAQGKFELPLGGAMGGEDAASEASAATGTGTAFGSPFTGRQQKMITGTMTQPQQRFETTYSGTEPGVKQLIERAYLDTYREPIAELGPHVPIGIPRRKALRTSFPPRDRTPSRPEGTLIAHLVEHTAAITSIAVSPDQLFFVTGSQDGTIKVWDAIRLEKNVTSKSRQTFEQGGKITAIAVVENSRCVVSANDQGTVLVHRVDVGLTGSMPKYGKPHLVRQRRMEGRGEYVTCLESYNTETTTNLILGTSTSSIVILDLRTMRDLHVWQNPSHLGPISCMCLDRKRVWLVVGTSSGYLSLWDLRFNLLLRSWSVSPGSDRVERVVVHPTKGKGRWIIVSVQDSTADDDDATTTTTPSGTRQIAEVWDLERALKVEEFRVAQPTPSGALSGLPPSKSPPPTLAKTVSTTTTSSTTPIFRAKDATLDPAKAIELLLEQAKEKRTKASDSPASSPTKKLTFEEGSTASDKTPSAPTQSRSTVKALLAGVDYSVTLEGISSSGSHPSGMSRLATIEDGAGAQEKGTTRGKAGGFLLTAGEDRKLRYWDLGKPAQSAIVSGQELEEEVAVFTLHSSTTRSSIYLESHPLSQRTSRVHRSTLIANHQQQLLRAHHDAITALAVIDLPFRCVITGDRSGVVKVFE